MQARLHLEFLTTKTTLRKLKDALTALPEGLNDTYDKTMERINSQYPDQATLARKVLCWLFYAYQPLTMLEVQHAVAVEIGDQSLDDDNIPEEGLLLSVCNGLVTYHKESRFLALVHYTFQQYLEEKANSLFPEAQIEIVRTCLTYLSFDKFGLGPCRDYQRFGIRLRKYPLLRYAAFRWSQHALLGAEEACSKLILSFFSHSAKLSASVQVVFGSDSDGDDYSVVHPAAGVSALWVASLYGLEHSVSQLLTLQKQDVNLVSFLGDTALHQAAGCGDVGILQKLLSNGADINATDYDGNTPLHRLTNSWPNYRSILLASYSAQNQLRVEKEVKRSDRLVEAACLLLNHGADVNAVNLPGETVLQLSVKKGHLALTQLFLARGVFVSLQDRFQIQTLPQTSPDREGRSLLHMSAYGSLQCLQYLENQGFDLQALDKQKRTCLHHAATNSGLGSGKMIQYLLDRGLDPAQSDVDGWTPLLWAARAGDVVNVEMLLEAGAGCNYQNEKEWVPFAIARYFDNSRAARILRPWDKPVPEFIQTQNFTMSMWHRAVLCDGCDLVGHWAFDCCSSSEGADAVQDIFGSRYRCSECSDFDYCFKCVVSAEITHPSHHFIFLYPDDYCRDVGKRERQDVMKKLMVWETFIKTCKV